MKIVEIGGPDLVLLPDLIWTALTARGDGRTVVTDPAGAGLDLERLAAAALS